MPILKARLRAVSDLCSLSLDVHHRLAPSGHDPADSIKNIARLPKDIPVYAAQTILISLSGSVNNAQATVDELIASRLFKNMRDYFEMATMHA
ncbi:hypothetical protein CC1G_07189 [Coprinopsis cinerea okayama7|uniref:Uncharacterized protein n=1 Tax=Coprinopsis cinerea (strain Okayama-7 / 130 / ATCC MYA-4618 / FGSC 9003) TaxID=240176 RepID=A8NRE2_COPC7|nr:hypothetical protein CC1G_07189 [Coprinopsis cinerea okayama7\|eukprot:XP_001835765.2 hypothetical protein CC1G_07189 [Coprinopsis cinerea okayama7\